MQMTPGYTAVYPQMRHKIQLDLNKIFDWIENMRLKINTEKRETGMIMRNLRKKKGHET